MSRVTGNQNHSKKATNIPMSRYENGSAGKSAPTSAGASRGSELATRPAVWRKSSYCQSGECIEVSALDGVVLMRDSKDPHGSVLRYDTSEWQAFLRGIRAGEFDNL
jgi:Domain of unknown function (DUF397)